MKKNTVSNMDTINAMSMMSFMFMLTKMSFSEIAEAYFNAEAEWAKFDFVGCSEFISAPWKSKAIKEYLIGKCCSTYRDELKDKLSKLSALADDAGEQIHIGACLFNDSDELEVEELIGQIGSLEYAMGRFGNGSY